MAQYEELLSALPIGQLAELFGASEDEVTTAASAAIPTLISGMAANAQDEAGAASLSKALAQHDPEVLSGGVDISQIDAQDGEKIVRHVFGENTEPVQNQLQGFLGGGLATKLLPMLAPLVLSWIAGKAGSIGKSSQTQSGGGLGGLFGGLVDKLTGRDDEPEPEVQSGGGLGDLLGGLLGGGSGSKDPSILDMLGGLGGLLGGGRR